MNKPVSADQQLFDQLLLKKQAEPVEECRTYSDAQERHAKLAPVLKRAWELGKVETNAKKFPEVQWVSDAYGLAHGLTAHLDKVRRDAGGR